MSESEYPKKQKLQLIFIFKKQSQFKSILFKLIMNFIYYFLILGFYFNWGLNITLNDWQWWVKLIMFALIINFHRPIVEFLQKYGK